MNRTQLLFKTAKKAADNAYAPYSKCFVGAAILGTNGKIYSGCNVENASYPVGVCAEASAISAMVVDGCRKIAEILVCSNGKKPITPCGACRQRIAEFSDEDTLVHFANNEEVCRTVKASLLLPYGFELEENDDGIML